MRGWGGGAGGRGASGVFVRGVGLGGCGLGGRRGRDGLGLEVH